MASLYDARMEEDRPMRPPVYGIHSRYYDPSYAAKKPGDIPFYLELARELGQPVIELGCGTGRISLPIAREGIEITAVDQSESMLSIFGGKLSREMENVQRRVTVYPGDIRAVRMEAKFRLAILPFRVFQHMHTIDDQIATLGCARDLLTSGGSLAFDVFMPQFERIAARIGEEIEEMAWNTIQNGESCLMRRFFIKDAFDPLTLTFRGRFIYRAFIQEKLVQEEQEELAMTCFTHSHLQLLFRITGLTPVAEYGAFDRTPLGPNSPEMIFVLRKR